jgi:hypothetical protein
MLMSCCAVGRCGRTGCLVSGPGMVLNRETRRWDCYLCYVMPGKFPQPASQQESSRRTVAAVRDGDPKLAAERKRNPVFTKRQRAGPHYLPSARRV